MNAQGFKAKVEGPKAIQSIVEFLSLWNFDESACQVKIDAIGATLDYKAVFAIWMRHLAKSFTERDKTGKQYSCDDMHDLMCHQFLGYVPGRTVGRTVIKSALRTITYPEDLTRTEFYTFLRSVEYWAADVGVQLPDNPSEYQRDKERETA